MIIEGILLIYSQQRLNFESKQKLILFFHRGRQGFAFWIEWWCNLEAGNQAEIGGRQERITKVPQKFKISLGLSSFCRIAWQCDGP
jgi:hypothetical protein